MKFPSPSPQSFFCKSDVYFYSGCKVLNEKPSAPHFNHHKLNQGFSLTSLTPISLLLDAICGGCSEVLFCWQPMASAAVFHYCSPLGHSFKALTIEYGGFRSSLCPNWASTCLFIDLFIALDTEHYKGTVKLNQHTADLYSACINAF